MMEGIKHSKPGARAGWIAPDGKFYPCAWYQHESLGQNLMLQFGYDSVERWEQDWLRLKYDPTTRAAPFIERGSMDDADAYSVTQAQFNTLHDILTAFLLGGIEAGNLKAFIQRARVREARR
jgi:hypothetical protein